MLVRVEDGRCPLCRAVNAGCGSATTHPGFEIRKEKPMAGEPLQEYDVVHNGVETRMSLNDADAKLYGAKPARSTDEEKKREPANKVAAAQNKAAG